MSEFGYQIISALSQTKPLIICAVAAGAETQELSQITCNFTRYYQYHFFSRNKCKYEILQLSMVPASRNEMRSVY